MKKLTFLFVLVLLASGAFPAMLEDIQIKQIDAGRLKYYPVPKDNKNYFFLQSIGNTTQIVIGDFSAEPKRIVLITLMKDFNTIKSVTEFYPRDNDVMVKKDSQSKYFTTDIVKLKRDIITGTIFNNNHADKMRSYNDLESIFKKNESSSVLPETYGFTVKLSEVDDKKKPMALFTFGRSETGYYLQFKTEYYRLNMQTTVAPVLSYSVYCRDTKDPLVAELVENLFKIRQPLSSGAEYKSKSN